MNHFICQSLEASYTSDFCEACHLVQDEASERKEFVSGSLVSSLIENMDLEKMIYLSFIFTNCRPNPAAFRSSEVLSREKCWDEPAIVTVTVTFPLAEIFLDHCGP